MLLLFAFAIACAKSVRNTAVGKNHVPLQTGATNENDTALLDFDSALYPFRDEGVHWETDDTVFTTLGTAHSFMIIKKTEEHVRGTREAGFYEFTTGNWRLIKKLKLGFGDFWRVGDLNFDGIDEVVLCEGPNMNGNTFNAVVSYLPLQHTFIYAGSLMGEIELNPKKRTVQETYTGSWYMGRSRTLYNWVNGELHTLKELYHEDLSGDMEHPYKPAVSVVYAVSKSSTSNKMKVLWKDRFDDSPHTEVVEAKFDSLWEWFFTTD
ncbi:MAG: hypothetical protein U0V74_04445 [Chitinophagales bacterium]